MLINQAFFNTLTEKETVDTSKYAQMTIALAFESREKVDEIVNTAVSLGGKLHAESRSWVHVSLGLRGLGRPSVGH